MDWLARPGQSTSLLAREEGLHLPTACPRTKPPFLPMCMDKRPSSGYSLMRLVELGALKKSGRYSHLMSAEFMGMAWLQRHG